MCRGQRSGQGAHDLADDLVLHGEDIGKVTVEAFGPDVACGGGVDQLGIYAHPAACPPSAALQHVSDAQLAGDLANISRSALVGEGRVPGDDEEAGNLRQIGDQVVGQAVGEISLLLIGTQVLERQHGDRRLVR